MANLKDIAERAGVNVSTVSRALKGSSEIKAETRNRIARIAGELGYRTKSPRKALPDAEKSNVGILCPEVKSDFYGQIVNTIEGRLKAEGYHLLIGLTHFKYENEQYYLDLFLRRGVTGIIFITSVNQEIARDLDLFRARSDIPIVQVGSEVTYDGYDYIEIDDDRGVALAVEHLVNLGHARIGYVGDMLSRARAESFKDALRRHGIGPSEDLVRIGDERFEEGGFLRMNELLRLPAPPTAVFASYDDIAIGAMRAIYDAGLRVPRDVSIVGMDNIGVTGYLHSRLTTVSEPVLEMGEIATRILLGKLSDNANRAIQHVALIPRLIVRETTAEPAQPQA